MSDILCINELTLILKIIELLRFQSHYVVTDESNKVSFECLEYGGKFIMSLPLIRCKIS
jgi:hypothetical protein